MTSIKVIKPLKDEFKATYGSKNYLVRVFFKNKANFAIKMADLKKTDVILDFGCGAGYLKNLLKNKGYNVIGYDITPEHSDIKDYKKVRPTKIFSLDVFEHIDKKEIKKIIKNFKKMSKKFDLILAIPTENLFSRKMRKLLGKSERVPDHITTLKEIKDVILKEGFKLKKKVDYFTISHLYLFRYSE